MNAPDRNQMLKDVTPEMIEAAYQRGKIFASQRNDLMREKAHHTVKELLGEHGYVQAVLAETLKNVQKGWDTTKQAVRDLAVPAPPKAGESAVEVVERKIGDKIRDFKNSAKLVWGQVEVLTSLFSAFGTVNGEQAERWALGAGASMGLARVINFGVDAGSAFLPIGAATRLGVKGVQGVQRVAQARRMGKAAEMVEEAQKIEEQAARAMESVEVAIKEGLELEGVKAGSVSAELSALRLEQQAALKEFEEMSARLKITKEEAIQRGDVLLTGQIPYTGPLQAAQMKLMKLNTRLEEAERAAGLTKGIELTPPSAVSSVFDAFAQDLRAFQAEMAKLTEVQTHVQTAKMAERLGYTLDDLRRVMPGQALDEKQMLAYLKALEPQIERMYTLAGAAMHGGTPELHAFAEQMSAVLKLAPIFRGAEITAGRSVEILKETPPMKAITDLLMGWDAEKIAAGDFQGAIRTLAEDMRAAGDAGTRRQDLLKKFILSQDGSGSWAAMAREAYINLLLARPSTHVRNLIGNSVSAFNEVAERLTGAIFSADRQAGIAGAEGWQLLKGFHAAFGDGLKAWADAFRGVDVQATNLFDQRVGAIPGVLGSIIRTPGNELRGVDNFMKTLWRRGSYYAEAYRDGAQQGLKGQELAAFVERRVNAPTQAMVTAADELALKNTYQNELGQLGKKVQSLAQTGPLVLWFPFMKTPINLAKYAWARTPGLQLISRQLYRDIAEGGPKADMAIARITLANVNVIFLYNLAQEGVLTGSGPVDPALRRVWLATHQPYSVKTPQGWIPISNTEPASTVVGMVADFAQIHNQLDDPSAEQTAMAITFTLMKNLADKTYWLTMNKLLNVASGVDMGQGLGEQAKDVLMAPATAVLTGGPLVAGIAKAIDPVQRETRGVVSEVIAKVPGYSKTLPPVRDVYGDPVLPPQAVGGAWLGLASPLTVKPLTEDRVKKEGERLHVKMPAFPWTMGGRAGDDFDIREMRPGDSLGVKLTPEERDRWQQLARGFLRSPEVGIEKMLLDNPMYTTDPETGQKQPQALQQSMFTDFLHQVRASARGALIAEKPELAKKILDSQATKVVPMLNDRRAGELQEQTGRALELFDAMAPEMRENLLRWGVLPEEATTP